MTHRANVIWWGIGAVVTIFTAGLLTYAYPQPPETPKLPGTPLKELAAKHGIQLGNFAMPKLYYEKPYHDILTSQFNVALVDNQPNWHFTDADLRPAPNK